MKQYRDDLYLDLAGCIIKITFGITDMIFKQKIMIKNISDYYGGFILDKKPTRFDAQINFEDSFSFAALVKGRKNYINVYDLINKQKIRSFYHIGPIHLQLIFRILLENFLAKRKGFIMHASTNNFNGGGIVFTGPPGEGKSTITKILHSKYRSLADDSLILRKIKDKFYIYQTPFLEKESWLKRTSEGFNLKRIYFLKKAKIYKIERVIDKNYILSLLLKQFWTDKEFIKKQIKTLMDLVANFDQFYILYFSIDGEKVINLIEKYS